jgi:D-alanyl-lipoteichoic acid acyltransferase DltB (MBOAT superfamily)
MVFNSWIFGVFLVAFAPVYALVRRRVVARNLVLIGASAIFYGWWDARFLILVAALIAVDYLAALGAYGHAPRPAEVAKSVGFLAAATACSLVFTGCRDLSIVGPAAIAAPLLCIAALVVERSPREASRRKAWLIVSLSANLGALAFFKYFDFFIGAAASALAAVGLRADFPTLHVILPLGLSFYTFQAIGRTVDAYRHVYEPKKSLINYAAFHAFFPQLVSGPIERAAHLMPQFETARPASGALIFSGALLALWGLFQKIVIADNLAPIADFAFDHSADQTAGATVAGVLAFAFQIYADFCGYSNMARGIARVLGFDLMRNFAQPYLARTPREFWRSWHISLSQWLRDYLYIPLGGGRDRASRNLMITMLLGGLWHGAAWTFIVWGAFHGAIQLIYRWLGVDRALTRLSADSMRGFAMHAASWACMFALVMIGWVFFRARGLGNAATVFSHALGGDGYRWDVFAPVLAYASPLAAADLYLRFRPAASYPEPFMLRYSFGIVVVMAIAAFAAQADSRFIYFDF